MKALTVAEALKRLEKHYGVQKPTWPVEPYEFLVWWHCGYPASDDRCEKGWKSLQQEIGISTEALLAATPAKLAHALKPGGMVPELRAQRMKEIALRVQRDFGGDLRAGLVGPLSAVRKILKSFPNIADPGADRILLFADLVAEAAVPSNCPHVLVRILSGAERENYGVTYKTAQAAIRDGLPNTFASRKRAFLLLKRHGQETCKLSKPKCDVCVLREGCAFANGKMRGTSPKERSNGAT